MTIEHVVHAKLLQRLVHDFLVVCGFIRGVKRGRNSEPLSHTKCGDNPGEKLVTPEDEEKEDLEKKIRRQNKMVIILGVVVFLIFVMMAYFLRHLKFPLPPGYPQFCALPESAITSFFP
jgi:predicted nucleic acid-binding Zn ribbon protein